MARRRIRRSRKEITVKSDETRSVVGILSLIVASLLVLSFFVDSPGFDIIRKLLGYSTLVAFAFFGNLALLMFRVDYMFTKKGSLVGQFILIFALAGILHFFLKDKEALVDAKLGEGGGMLGYTIAYGYLIDIFARSGAFIILLSSLIVAATLIFNSSFGSIIKLIGKFIKAMGKLFSGMDKKLKEAKEEEAKEKGGEEQPALQSERMIGDLHSKDVNEEEKKEEKKEDESKAGGEKESSESKKVVIDEDVAEGALVNSSLNYPNWKFPPPSLLTPPKNVKGTNEDVKRNADIIEQTLQSFGVKTKVVDVVIGPTVTQYALNIALGTRASRISNLKTDLALALAAPTGMVRIEAPIPGTSYIGIEIPNEKKETVFIREVIESKEMAANSMQLPMTVGKSINGKSIVVDLQKMPHLLVAGATGSGKSVLINAFIMSILMTRTPDEVRMIMVDPKQVELYDYNGIPHLLTPVITDTEKVINSLKWAIIEMERRYTIFRHARVRDIRSYNEYMGFAAMPYILIIIDEMADLMLSSGAETESAVVRIAQKARATGIHLVLATQRPSVDILTGLIKANISARIGLSVATQVDSRVILDQIGAETLLGAGDLLFKEPDKSKPYRIQGVWVSHDEVKRVVKFILSQTKEVNYATEVTEKQKGIGPRGVAESATFSDDSLFADAVRIVCNARKGSASLLQRKLSIGYNRAARLLDELFTYGVVGAEEGSKPRKVLIDDPEKFLQKKATKEED